MDPVRFGIIGVGNMGSDHARKLKAGKAAGAEVAALCDIDRAKVATLGAEIGVPTFTNYRKMVDSGLIDAVLVATPHYWHAPQTIYAARKGLHVLCEKPASVTVGAAKLMQQECERAGVVYGIMFMQRLRPVIQKAREVLASGQIGEVFRVHMVASTWLRNQSYYNSGGWRGTWLGEGGGILMNQAPHSLDLLILLGGMPRRVTANVQTRVHQIEVENTANAILDYGDGKMGYLYATTAEAPGTEELVLSGNRGTLAIRGNKLSVGLLETPLDEHLMHCAEGFKGDKAAWNDLSIDGMVDRAHMGLTEQFARAVREGGPLVADGHDGIREIELCDAIYLAGFTGKTVDLPLKDQDVERLITRLGRERGRKDAENLRGPANRELKRILNAQ